jgi:hypothetical protein
MMTKKCKRPRRSLALEGDEAEPLSPPPTDPTKERKRNRAPRSMTEEEFYRQIGTIVVRASRSLDVDPDQLELPMKELEK